jgi:polyhydroxyalkanoate synthesis repressor PhaR
MTAPVHIKKYANRRLYDMEKSKYVTLIEVAEMIKNGRAIEVSDANTDEDVTAFILTQIVLEKSKQKKALLPVPLLHLIIRYGDNILNEFFEKYLQITIDRYVAQRVAFDDHFKKMIDLGMGWSDMAQKSIVTPFKPFMDIFSSDDKKEKEDNE